MKENYNWMRALGDVCDPPEIRELCETCLCYNPESPAKTKYTTLCYGVWWYENVYLKEQLEVK